ncbi:cell envelope integrity protein TolA [Vibrio scophthalmi]|uniref:Inner centromere protein n=1 Tax=Vibrio scophthalmi TaxID=45658 RepID=A0A1C7F7Q5_9VIBR|nr:cell envelope integrity protein TolA [Vibrio scophthalmi]ANU35972.1 Inner centromere protein [Vibrio scophthalmi]
MKDKKPNKNKLGKPMVISFALHAVLLAALLWGADFTMSKPEPVGRMVEAVVIDPALVRKQAQQIREQREEASRKEQDRLDKLRRESEQLEKNRKAEEERIRKLKEQQVKEAKAARDAEKLRKQKEQERKVEEERVRKEKERAVKLEQERKKKEDAIRVAEKQRLEKEAAVAKAEQQRIEKEAAAAKAEQQRIEKEKAAKAAQEAAAKAEKERIAKEKAAKEAAEKARKEKQRLERLERERKEQEAAMNDIFAGLESETEQNSAARNQFVDSEISRYAAIYTQLIKQNLLVEDYFRGKSCRVNLRLIPTGAGAIVGNFSILDGDSRVCSATKRAVAQVPSFPLPTDADLVNKLKNINLTVEL